MQIDFFGLTLQTPKVTCYLWSPWRASALEHRLFDAVRLLPGVETVQVPDELHANLPDAKTFKQVITAVSRIVKGWQEEATDAGRERRLWRWLFEGDTDDHGYDHAGEPACLWAFLRLAIDRGGYEEGQPSEEIDLNGFGLRIWPSDGKEKK